MNAGLSKKEVGEGKWENGIVKGKIQSTPINNEKENESD